MSHIATVKKLLAQPLIKFGICLMGLIPIAQGIGFALRWNTPVNQFRRALEDRHEYRYPTDEFGDYSHYFTGRLPISRFQEMVELFDASPHRVVETKPLSQWQPVSEPWWKMPSDFDEQYLDINESSILLLGRAGEHVYFQWISW